MRDMKKKLLKFQRFNPTSKDSKPKENTNNITIHKITRPTSTEIKNCGNFSIIVLQQVVCSTYEETIKGKRDLFMLLSGNAGKEYIDECTCLILE